MPIKWPHYRTAYGLREGVPCVIYYRSGGDKSIWKYACNESDRLFYFGWDID